MNSRISHTLWIACLITTVLAGCTDPADHSATVFWAEDFETARIAARKHSLPILINFSGTDWCPACQRIDDEVFSSPAWKEYARRNLITVRIDLSKEEFMDMRTVDPATDTLRIRYDITRYPSFVLLDADGETELGRFGPKKLLQIDSTSPKAFHNFMKPYLRYRSVEIDRLLAGLYPVVQSTYRELAEQRKALFLEFRELQSQTARSRRQFWAASAAHRELIGQKEYMEGSDAEQIAQLNGEIEQAFRRKKEAWQKVPPIDKSAREIYAQINKIEVIMNRLRTDLIESDRLPSIPPALQEALNEYQELPGKKALYIAAEPDGRFALGAGHGKTTWTDAIVDARNACQMDRFKKNISSRAVLYALNDRILHETNP